LKRNLQGVIKDQILQLAIKVRDQINTENKTLSQKSKKIIRINLREINSSKLKV
jgi:hypothetical protein